MHFLKNNHLIDTVTNRGQGGKSMLKYAAPQRANFSYRHRNFYFDCIKKTFYFKGNAVQKDMVRVIKALWGEVKIA